MKETSLAFLFISIQIKFCKATVASEAIVSILENNFNDSWPAKVDLVYFGNAIKLVDDVMHRLSFKFSVKVINSSLKVASEENLEKANDYLTKYSEDSEDRKFRPWNYGLRTSSVLLFESEQKF